MWELSWCGSLTLENQETLSRTHTRSFHSLSLSRTHTHTHTPAHTRTHSRTQSPHYFILQNAHHNWASVGKQKERQKQNWGWVFFSSGKLDKTEEPLENLQNVFKFVLEESFLKKVLFSSSPKWQCWSQSVKVTLQWMVVGEKWCSVFSSTSSFEFQASSSFIPR